MTSSRCEQCQLPFTPNSARNRFCSRECQVDSYRGRSSAESKKRQETGFMWEPVRPARPVKVTVPRSKPVKRDRRKTALVLPDPQFGYRWLEDNTLEAFHDEAALSIARQIAEVERPDLTIWLGDFLDLAPLGRYRKEEGLARTVQAAIDRGYEELAIHRALCNEMRVIEGNHDARLHLAVIDNLVAASGLRRAARPHEFPALSVPNLLCLDDLDTKYVGAYPAGACVPTDTTALTRTGWKAYDEITVGDEVLGYEEGRMRWTPVEKVLVFDDMETVRLDHPRFPVEATPNHRWVTDRRNARRERVVDITPMDEMTSEHRLILSAPAEGGDSPLTPDEAAILAWLHTDGCVRWAPVTERRTPVRGVDARIVQSTKKFTTKVVDLLDRVGVAYSTYSVTETDRQYRLAPDYVRALWDKAGLHERTLESLVTELSVEARSAFIEACWLAEGSQRREREMFQNRGDTFDAMRMALFLEGSFVSTRPHGDRDCWAMYGRAPFVSGSHGRFTKTTPTGRQRVWCVKTPLESWVAKQGDMVFLTGNTYINDNLACIHGRKLDVGQVLNDERTSLIQGHIHRIDIRYSTRNTRDAPKFTVAMSPGTLARIDGAVPSMRGGVDLYGKSVRSWENWQQGVLVVRYEPGDGLFDLEMVPIFNGRAYHQGHEYLA